MTAVAKRDTPLRRPHPSGRSRPPVRRRRRRELGPDPRVRLSRRRMARRSGL